DAPSLSPDDLQHAAERFPGDMGKRLIIPELRAADGRQDLSHFWFYPLLAAPFVRLAIGFGADPIRGVHDAERDPSVGRSRGPGSPTVEGRDAAPRRRSDS